MNVLILAARDSLPSVQPPRDRERLRFADVVDCAARARNAAHFVKDYDFAQDLICDTSRIRRDLRYQEQVRYHEGMRRTLGRSSGARTG